MRNIEHVVNRRVRWLGMCPDSNTKWTFKLHRNLREMGGRGRAYLLHRACEEMEARKKTWRVRTSGCLLANNSVPRVFRSIANPWESGTEEARLFLRADARVRNPRPSGRRTGDGVRIPVHVVLRDRTGGGPRGPGSHSGRGRRQGAAAMGGGRTGSVLGRRRRRSSIGGRSEEKDPKQKHEEQRDLFA